MRKALIGAVLVGLLVAGVTESQPNRRDRDVAGLPEVVDVTPTGFVIDTTGRIFQLAPEYGWQFYAQAPPGVPAALVQLREGETAHRLLMKNGDGYIAILGSGSPPTFHFQGNVFDAPVATRGSTWSSLKERFRR